MPPNLQCLNYPPPVLKSRKCPRQASLHSCDSSPYKCLNRPPTHHTGPKPPKRLKPTKIFKLWNRLLLEKENKEKWWFLGTWGSSQQWVLILLSTTIWETLSSYLPRFAVDLTFHYPFQFSAPKSHISMHSVLKYCIFPSILLRHFTGHFPILLQISCVFIFWASSNLSLLLFGSH